MRTLPPPDYRPVINVLLLTISASPALTKQDVELGVFVVKNGRCQVYVLKSTSQHGNARS